MRPWLTRPLTRRTANLGRTVWDRKANLEMGAANASLRRFEVNSLALSVPVQRKTLCALPSPAAGAWPATTHLRLKPSRGVGGGV